MKNMYQSQDRILQFLASQLTFPSHSSGNTYTNVAGAQQGLAIPINLPEGGDPVVVGRIAGVVASDALRSTQLMSVYVRGTFNLSCSPVHGLSVGETVYINPTTAVLSDDSTGVPFGFALDALIGTGTIRVRLAGPTPGAVGTGS